MHHAVNAASNLSRLTHTHPLVPDRAAVPSRQSRRLCLLLSISLSMGLSACSLLPTRTDTALAPMPYPVRFILTFDDGPSLWQPYNPTSAILDQLAHNDVQPQIKALFFVQTRNPQGGATAAGQALLQREHDEGHRIELHSGSARGHVNNRWLSTPELAQSLVDGKADIRTISGQDPRLLRPPFWDYDARTYATYQAHALGMLETDIAANDGKIWGYHISLRRRSHLRSELIKVRAAVAAGRLPVIDGVVPIVVTFHDTNDYTARHMSEYLHILVEEAATAALPLAKSAFYDNGDDAERAALLRAEFGVYLRQGYR